MIRGMASYYYIMRLITSGEVSIYYKTKLYALCYGQRPTPLLDHKQETGQ